MLHSDGIQKSRRTCAELSALESISVRSGNVNIIAPDERDYFSLKGEIGPRKAKYQDENGEYISEDHESTDIEGNWIKFKRKTTSEHKDERENGSEDLKKKFEKDNAKIILYDKK